MTPSNIASSSPTNWFLLVQTVGIVAGLMFSGWALYLMVRTTRVTNLLQLTQFHRQIWNMVIERPDLREALRHDFSPTTITDEQRLFIRFLVLHLSASFIATRAGALFEQEGLATDVATFFSLPGPAAVWEEQRRFHTSQFVSFVDQAVTAVPGEQLWPLQLLSMMAGGTT